ncbi:glucose-1-phosphate thymidylyltransferase [Streptomyces sp. RerS4]|uniref:glucose-1-phosphate thymidylyltransferase n=1 Tax=Streptomyces sp. RerS4 TaxID=2942449 RepID=UPI00201BE112|nr:glucose-1-phosphate thymidylyltransferase [Streptomyces sp. RerS4]UQX03430.1 glucose-1-phosphate thymidylyltransferase [Streptomyces sp. RerS4]
MKALVLSGGTGTRLRPLTHSMPKQLMPIANKPVLEYVLDDIRAMGVTDVGIIVNHWAPAVRERIGDGSRLGLRVTYIRQDEALGLAHAVTVGRSFLGDEDFVLYLGDSVLTEGAAHVADTFRATRPAAHVVVCKVGDPRAFGVVEVDADGAVVGLEEKPEHPAGDLAMTGVYFFTPAIHDAIAAITPSRRGELEVTDAIQFLLTSGAEVHATVYTGVYKDNGRVEDILDCNRVVLEGLRPELRGEVDRGSEVSGPVTLGPGARIIRSKVEGPAIIGAGTRIEDCHIRPYTSIGDDCTMRDSQIAYSIVLDQASVTGVRGLHGSVIGRAAAVTAAPGVRRTLVLGDHSRIEIEA